MSTSLRLSYIPIPESEHVYLNGVEMRRNIDWSIDGSGLITCLSPMDERSSDKLECRYAHKGLRLLSLPQGTVWKYRQGLGTSNAVAISSLGYNDSSWSSGPSFFGTAAYWSDPQVVTDLTAPLDLWIRLEVTSHGNPINFSGYVDNHREIWVDGVQKDTFSSFFGGPHSGSFALAAGHHAIAVYGSGDSSAGDILAIEMSE